MRGYQHVEQWLLDHHTTYRELGYPNIEGGTLTTSLATFEDVGRLARLSAGLRSDGGRLPELAGEVEELMAEAIDNCRNRELTEVA